MQELERLARDREPVGHAPTGAQELLRREMGGRCALMRKALVRTLASSDRS